jgi:hypothetical protein
VAVIIFTGMRNIPVMVGICSFAVGVVTLRADEPVLQSPTAGSSVAASSAGTRYSLFDWLDSRSEYGQGAFPEPFLVDDSDLEVNEARLDWLHTRAGGTTGDLVTAEVEKGFGLVTLELEVPCERGTTAGTTTEGFDNIDLGARCPFYQFVSRNGLLDTTFGAAIEAGIPTGSPVSKNTELVPKLFNDLKVDNFTLQSIIGYSTLFGPGDDGGLQTFEYGFVFGYTIDHQRLPLPGVRQIIPVFELSGETELNQADPGRNSVLGNAALRVNLKTIGRVQPRLGLGFVFPLDQNAHTDVHCGVFTSLVFEY